jgi:hypothetical protein
VIGARLPPFTIALLSHFFHRELRKLKTEGRIKGVNVSINLNNSCSFCIANVIFFGNDNSWEAGTIKEALQQYGTTID